MKNKTDIKTLVSNFERLPAAAELTLADLRWMSAVVRTLKVLIDRAVLTDRSGTIPDQYVTGQVTDVLGYPGAGDFPAVGAEGKYYVDESAGVAYVWRNGRYEATTDKVLLEQVYSELKRKANDSDVVHLSGNELVSGHKRFDTQVTVGTRQTTGDYTGRGEASFVQGANCAATGADSHAEGSDAVATGTGAHAEGHKSRAAGDYSHAGGFRAVTASTPQNGVETRHNYAYAWQGFATGRADADYRSHGPGTYNVNPAPAAGETDVASGFFIGNESLKSRLDAKADLADGKVPASELPEADTEGTVAGIVRLRRVNDKALSGLAVVSGGLHVNCKAGSGLQITGSNELNLSGVPKSALAQAVQDTLDGADAVAALVPAAASAQNQLADKDFVNSSISTSTATFRGTYNLATDLLLTTAATREQVAAALAAHLAAAGVVSDDHDYCFVEVPVDDEHLDRFARVDRYKCTEAEVAGQRVATWSFEWSLNNSSFTAAQWEAIMSGVTSGKVSGYDAHVASRGNPHNVTASQIGAAVASEMSVTSDGSDKKTIQLRPGVSATVLVAHQDISGKVGTNALDGQSFDFSTAAGTNAALKALVELFGGTVTNFPGGRSFTPAADGTVTAEFDAVNADGTVTAEFDAANADGTVTVEAD